MQHVKIIHDPNQMLRKQVKEKYCGAEWETEEFPEIKIKGVKSLSVELWEHGE